VCCFQGREEFIFAPQLLALRCVELAAVLHALAEHLDLT
jgi:hypothetical protein